MKKKYLPLITFTIFTLTSCGLKGPLYIYHDNILSSKFNQTDKFSNTTNTHKSIK